MAKSDPGRLTTPAGRLDDINLPAFCYSELLEEFVFYGLGGGNTVRLYTIFPPNLRRQYRPKQRLIKRLLSKNISIPGIDSGLLKEEADLPEEAITIVQDIDPSPILAQALRDLPVWQVVIEIKGRLSPRPAEFVYVIFDKENCTVEFRMLASANISNFDPHATTKSRVTFGRNRLMGIADGDGLRRRTFLLNAKVLADYRDTIGSLSQNNQLANYILSSERESVEITAIGDGTNSGRFTDFNLKVPVLPLTTSVCEMARLTRMLI